MPFTPFHLGAGAVFKAMGAKRMSFLVFGGSQVLMDIEPLIGIMRGWDVLHGYSHTLLGALLIGVLAAGIGKPISNGVLRWLELQRDLPQGQSPRSRVTWHAACAGALLGTFSHLVLDGIMHADIRPLWPLSSSNPFLYLLDLPTLHMLCVTMMMVGGVVVGWRGRWSRRR